jgi:quercetin dioxygenase-like cupin family protein
MRRMAIAVGAAAVVVGVIAGVAAQQATFKRTILQQVEISVPGREVVTAVAEIPPGVAAGRHTHPGEEVGYMLEGTVVIEVDGKPPVEMGPGKAFVIPSGAVHNATNRGSTLARVLATYVVEKGKPVATPAK